MATYNYQTKTPSTFVYQALDSAAIWDDSATSWDDAGEFWGNGNTPAWTYQTESAGGGSGTATAGLYYGFGCFTYAGGETIGGSGGFTYQIKN